MASRAGRQEPTEAGVVAPGEGGVKGDAAEPPQTGPEGSAGGRSLGEPAVPDPALRIPVVDIPASSISAVGSRTDERGPTPGPVLDGESGRRESTTGTAENAGIHITIGRVEIRAVRETRAATSGSAASSPQVTLESYLRRSTGGKG